MGAFFTNVQIFVRGRDEAEAKRRVAEELARIADDADLAPARGDEEADRTILIECGDGVISVLDEATEGQDADEMSALASSLSLALSAPAMTVTVHDSDVLYLTLFDEHGEEVDAYNSHPSFFGEVSASEKKRVAGAPEKWRALLRTGATTHDLARTWKEKKLFCEETLGATLDLLGLERARAMVGFNYAQQSERAYERFAFRARVRPAYETKVTGAPRFSTMSYAQTLEVSRGFPVHVTYSAKNEGGASRGMRVVLSGEAITRGLLTLDRCQLVIGQPQDRNVVEAPFAATGKGDGARLTAAFPDVEIPPGSAGELGFGPGVDPRKMVAAMYASNVHANIHGTGGSVGSGALRIQFVPSADEAGAVEHELTIATTAAPRRPLRAPEDSHAHVLRPLELRGTLFLLVMLDRPQDAALPFVRRALASFAPHAAKSGSYQLAIFKAAPGERPATGTAKAEGFFGSARFAKLCDEMAVEAVVSATCGDNMRDFTSAERSFGDGFSFGTSILPSGTKSDPELPTLGLWLDVSEKRDAEIDRARATLHAIADDAMKNERGAQAIVARWGWAPSQSLDTTAYELATDIQGQVTLRRSWATRYLRGVATGTLWLGKDIAERVTDRSALAKIAVVESLGDVLKITVRRDEELDAVEQALAPLLPTQEEYRRAVDAKYGR